MPEFLTGTTKMCMCLFLHTELERCFVYLCLYKGCTKLSLFFISKLELIALYIISSLLLVLLSSSVLRFNDLTIGVILVSFEYSPVMNLFDLF